MSRTRLPSRRVARTESVLWPPPPDAASKKIHVTAGFYPSGRVGECFIRGGTKAGHERDSLYDDLAVVLSRLLQYGDTLADIEAGLSGRGDPTDDVPKGRPASLIGAIVEALMKLENDERADVRNMMAALAGKPQDP